MGKMYLLVYGLLEITNVLYSNITVKVDALVKSRKMAIFENLHLIITASYKAEFGKF